MQIYNPIPVIHDGKGKLISSYVMDDWFNKLNEELDEIKFAVWNFEHNKSVNVLDKGSIIWHIAEELQDLKTVCTSMQSWLGYDEKMRDKVAREYLKPNNTLKYESSDKWIRALNVSLDQIKIDGFSDSDNSSSMIKHLLILIAVCTAMQMRYCGFNKSELDKICAKVNEKNEKRGYFSKG